MRKLILSGIWIFVLGTCYCKAQSLQGTQWKSFFKAPINDTATLIINRDSSFINNGKGQLLVSSVYKISGDTMSINDVGGMISCGDAPAEYKISRTSEKLTLTIMQDPCDGRANSLSGREWTKVKN